MVNLRYEFKNNGLYIGLAKAFLPCIEKLSLIYHAQQFAKKKGLVDRTGKRVQPWVAELFQLASLVISFILLLNVESIAAAPCLICLVLFSCAYHYQLDIIARPSALIP